MKEILVIDQVLLLRNLRESRELGRVLWAAMKEIETFYNYDQERVVFRRTYLSEEVPSGLQSRHSGFLGLNKVWEYLFRRGEDEKEAASTEQFKKTSEASWRAATGKYSQTYKASKIIEIVRTILSAERKIYLPVIITDQTLIPPKNWRYIIWDALTDGVVLSTVPLDPEYWRLNDRNRIATIKHRVRTGCLQIIGGLIGLDSCNNKRCFLFDQVDSVTRLDYMVELGPEHRIEAISERGFGSHARDPSIVQSIEENPEPAMEEF